MQFTTEQMQKAKQAKSAEELLAIAKANGFEMTEEQAKTYFSELNKEGELTDEELSAVVGGEDKTMYYRKSGTGTFNKGDIVEDDAGIRYEIQNFDSEQHDGCGNVTLYWYRAIVTCVPVSAKPFTGLSEGDEHYVHSAIVKKVN